MELKYDPSHVAGPERPLFKLLGSVAARIIEAAHQVPLGLGQQLTELEHHLKPAFHPETGYAAYSDQELQDMLSEHWLERRPVVQWLHQQGIETEEARSYWPVEIVSTLSGLR